MPVQNTDVNGNPYGITYTAAGETWKVTKNVDVFGTVGAVFSQFVNSTLINKGSLFGNSYGVFFNPSGAPGNFLIKNAAPGDIKGQYAIYVVNFDGMVDIQNLGEIDGSNFGILTSGMGPVNVVNEGETFGGTFAIFLASTGGTGGPVINNYGLATSPQYGIYISGPSTVQAKINNYEDATIKGGLTAIQALQPLLMKNKGVVKGNILTSAYDDKIVNKAKIKGDTNLGTGVDTFKNKGKAGLIDTQDGNDLVILGDKKDKLLFDSALNALTNVDTVKKFTSDKDKMYLDDDIFTTLTPGTLPATAFHIGSAAADADDRIIYDKPTGAVYYDPDGTGAMTQTQFAKLDPNTNLKASDFIAGEYTIIFV